MMDDPLNIFERLASQGQGETPSRTNVAGRVLATLQTQQTVIPAREPELLLLGIGSFVAACAAMVVFWIGTSDNSLFALAQPFVTVLQ